jgi:hypothetical protein
VTRGWWDVEWDALGSSCWTGGDALLPSLSAGVLEVDLAGTMRYALGGSSGGEVAELARLAEWDRIGEVAIRCQK